MTRIVGIIVICLGHLVLGDTSYTAENPVADYGPVEV